MAAKKKPVLECRFYRTANGAEPVRDWLKSLPASARREIGADIGTICDVRFLPEEGALIVGNGLWFERVEKGEIVWKSRRISWDGMMNVTVAAATLVGEAYDPMTDAWTPFEVDVETGELRGGSYPLELP